MSLPEPCSWFPADTPCADTDEFKRELGYVLTEGPVDYTHAIRTDYSMTVGGATIPLVKTVRDFHVNYSVSHGAPPDIGGVAVFNATTGSFDLFDCNEQTAGGSSASTTVSDNCVIEKSTLHYLDQRYGVCLYRYQKDEIAMSVVSTETADFRTTTPGQGKAGQSQIKTGNYTAKSTEEWRLIIDGIEQVLTHTETLLEPFGPRNNGLAAPPEPFIPDPETRLILVFPQPPSLSIPQSPEVMRLGFYDYGNLPGEESELSIADGGYKDMFYPEWCRSLQEDPFWRSAADRRYLISWFHVDLIANDPGYVPPPVPVDPLPIGSFARHPGLGDIYQFLVGNTPVTSPDLRELIDSQLPDDMKTHDTTLIYPISLA